MVKCYICDTEFEPDPAKLAAWAESGEDFEPTDWECNDCYQRDFSSDIDYEEYPDDMPEQCECGICYCMNDIRGGGVCSQCLNGLPVE